MNSIIIEEIKELLRGIDQTDQTDQTDDGWWETSIGAKFGEDRLKKLIELLKNDKVE
jgi:hypothetical protein